MASQVDYLKAQSTNEISMLRRGRFHTWHKPELVYYCHVGATCRKDDFRLTLRQDGREGVRLRHQVARGENLNYV
jgi:hypothetical protein